MKHNIYSLDRLSWVDGENIRPYIFVRGDNKITDPGTRFDGDWFPFETLHKDPLEMDNVGFADSILELEHSAFKKSSMPMPRWVFYDCAIMPGFVAGFAHKTSTLPEKLKNKLKVDESQEWTPISLFIIIPSNNTGEWVAHNLCSINSQLEKPDRFYGLGFLTKAFGLWYANIDVCCGMTQWTSPALRLHAHYGVIEILTSYTPVHDYAHTVTYRVKVDPDYWSDFFKFDSEDNFDELYESANFLVDPEDEQSLISLQRKIEQKKGPFYLRPSDIRASAIGEPVSLYKRKK